MFDLPVSFFDFRLSFFYPVIAIAGRCVYCMEDEWTHRSAEEIDELLLSREDFLNHDAANNDDVDTMPEELRLEDDDSSDATSDISGSSAFSEEDRGNDEFFGAAEGFLVPDPLPEADDRVVLMAGPSHDDIFEDAERQVDNEVGKVLDEKIALLATSLAEAEKLKMTKFADQCRRGESRKYK